MYINVNKIILYKKENFQNLLLTGPGKITLEAVVWVLKIFSPPIWNIPLHDSEARYFYVYVYEYHTVKFFEKHIIQFFII